MNLKTNDRLSSALSGILLLLLPIAIWQPLAFLASFVLVGAFIYLNRNFLGYLLKLKGVWFAVATIPWQLLYFFYSGVTFVVCWFIYSLPETLGLAEREVG